MANDRISLIDEVQKTIDPILDESKNMLDITIDKCAQINKEAQDITSRLSVIIFKLNTAAIRLNDLKNREVKTIERDLDTQYQKENKNHA